ncbi:MAG: hypothetical protein AAFU54_08365 [Chloroflexota bacterium]
MFDPLDNSRRTDALDLLKTIQTALEADDIGSALDRTKRLQKQLAEWQRVESIRDAKQWLDDALADELLAFNSETARQQIETWRRALNEDDITIEVDAFETRVNEQARRKTEAIQVRGVKAHCDELFQKAAELEQSETPPNPHFVISNYYSKALNIASAAKAELPNSPELDILQRKAEQLHSNKQVATRIYPMALEDDKYTEALGELDRLPTTMAVPRFVLTSDGDDRRTTFSSMVTQDAARTEIKSQALQWATRRAEDAIKAAQTALDGHAPEDAVDALDMSERLDKLLTPEMQLKLNDIRQQAGTTLQSKHKAEELRQKALEQAGSNDVGAWDTLAQAENLYQWIDDIPQTRETILRAMRKALHEMVEQAERAFHEERQMEQVQALHRQGQTNYSGKHDSLNEYLDHLNELNDMTKQYEEYLRTANELYQQVRDQMWEDAVGANDILTQLESYPDIVLEAFPDLYDTRQQVNIRLSADTLYGDLYRVLFEPDANAVREAIENVKSAEDEYPSDNRFPSLRDALNMHLYFLNAQDVLQQGNEAEARQALQAVAGANDHPDQQHAQELLDSLSKPEPPPAAPPDADREGGGA